MQGSVGPFLEGSILLLATYVLLAASGLAVRCTCRGGWAVRARSRTYRAAPSMCRRGAGSPRPSNPKPNPDPNPNPNPNPNPWTLTLALALALTLTLALALALVP